VTRENEKVRKRRKVEVETEEEQEEEVEEGVEEEETGEEEGEYKCEECGADDQEWDSWIGCDFCIKWFHISCTKQENTKDVFKCKFCALYS